MISKLRLLIPQGYFYILLIFCFIIPFFPQLGAILSIIFFLFWLLEGNFSQRFRILKTEKYRFCFLLPVLFFMCHCIRFLFSTNDAGYELFDIQTKLFLFILPLLFLVLPLDLFSRKKVNYYFIAFICGFLSYSVYTLIRALYSCIFQGALFQYEFFYSYLSDYIHPSYASLFGIFALLFCFYLREQKEKILPRWLCEIFIWIIPAYICLLSSRIGIISLILVLLILTFYRIHKKKRYWSLISLMVLLIVLSVAAIQKTEIAKARYNDVKSIIISSKNTSNTSNNENVRIVLWKSAFNGFLHGNIWIGEGPAKVKSTIAKEAEKLNAPAVAGSNYNAHNQFLQTLLALGIIGFVILLSCFVVPFCIGIKYRLYFLIIFIVVLTINNLAESMLEVFKGNLFFGFFFCFFFLQGFSKIRNKTMNGF